MSAISLENINVLSELERLGWAWAAAGGDEVKCLCPAHADTSPSCSINIAKRLWKCQAASCGAGGDIVTFIALAVSRVSKTVVSRATIENDLRDRYNLTFDKTIDMERVEEHHAAVWSAGPLLKALYDRGLTESLIRKYRIGFAEGRIIIPILNAQGACVNLRKYLPGAPTAEKFVNVKGFGKPRLYPIEQLKFTKIIVCGGECKAIVTADRMNSLGYGAICLTTGEGKDWGDEHVRQFKGKDVYVCMDVDEGGVKATKIVCYKMCGAAGSVFSVSLPLDKAAFPKGDLNDFFGVLGKTPEDLLAVLKSSPQHAKLLPPVDDDSQASTEPPTKVHLSESTAAKLAGKRIELRAMVTAMDETPYLIPKKVKFTCGKDQKNCDSCPVFAMTQDDHGSVLLDIRPDSPAVLNMIKTAKKQQRINIREALRMPSCKTVKVSIQSLHNVEDIRLCPQLEISSRAADHVTHPCYFVGKGLELNQGYDFECRTFPHPKSQQAILLAYASTAASDALSVYHPTTEELAELDVFQCNDMSITDKLKAIYDDFATNVTRIWKRQELHFAMDLAFHSALLLKVDGRLIKGWAEVLIVGDSSQGKSETAAYMMKHYGLGEKIECKNASVAGLLGGIVQVGTRHFVQWGIIPMHDKRLVVLEELKGASTEVFSKLTDMRSSGMAEIPKIEKRRTHARTRLVCISNPRGNRALANYNFGVEAVVELIGGLEDLRRFDLTVLVEKSQVDSKEINKLHRDAPAISHVYTADLCKKLVLWTWTRTADQVIFAEGANEALITEAIRLCETFSEEVPIIDRGSTRYKLARLSVALAGRLFSCDETRQNLVVKPEHIQHVSQFLESQYSSPAFGYGEYSRAVALSQIVKDPDEVKKRIFTLPFPKDFVDTLLYTSEIEVKDFGDWCAYEKGDAISLLSYFVRKHALVREKCCYRKTAAFIDLLKTIKGSDDLKKMNRPDFIKEPSESQY